MDTINKIDWNESFSVGVASMDDQHKNIIKCINLLTSDIEVNVSSETVSELLTQLTKYSIDHFKAEEQLLEKYGYPDIESQREEHRTYRIKVITLCQDAMSHQNSVPTELLKFIHDWWRDHILTSDMKYKAFLQLHTTGVHKIR